MLNGLRRNTKTVNQLHTDVIEFSPDTPVQAISIIQLMQKNPTYYRMEGGQRLKVMVQLAEYDKRIQFIVELLNKLLGELHG